MLIDTILRQLRDEGSIRDEDSILVACGGDTDARALHKVGIKNATISNLDQGRNDGIGGYRWHSADAEDLPFPDQSYDWGLIHQGLHHCASPHRGLLELLRVSRKGVIVVEARDSLLNSAAVRMGFTPLYEVDSVALGGGGVRNTPVPNFIYRWTEREVEKTVESARPEMHNRVRFFYGLVLPEERMTMQPAPIRAAFRVAAVAVKLLFKAARRQGNQFGFVVTPGPDKEWITRDPTPRLDPNYRLGFDPSKYVREEVERLESPQEAEAMADAVTADIRRP